MSGFRAPALVLVAAVWSWSAAAAAEGLRFAQSTCEVTPPDDATGGEAVFPFVNASAKTVTILLVRAGCPCVAPRLEKTTFRPGEGGEVRADLRFGSMTGVQRRRLEVLTNCPEALSTALEVVMRLPSGPGFTPRIVRWQVGEAPGTKTVQVTIPGDFHHRLLRASSAQSAVTASLVAGPDGAPQIEVAVADTTHGLVARIEVEADTGKRYQVFAQVGDGSGGDVAPLSTP